MSGAQTATAWWGWKEFKHVLNDMHKTKPWKTRSNLSLPTSCNKIVGPKVYIVSCRLVCSCPCCKQCGEYFAFCNTFTACYRRVRPLQGCRSSPSLRGSPRHCIALEKHSILLLQASRCLGFLCLCVIASPWYVPMSFPRAFELSAMCRAIASVRLQAETTLTRPCDHHDLLSMKTKVCLTSQAI